MMKHLKTYFNFDHPGRMLALYLFFAMILWTLLCSLLQNILPLDAVETIVWGAQWQWGHFKHPPFSGWMGYFFSWISGHADWSVYWAEEICIAIGVWYTYLLGRRFFEESAAASAALLLYFIHYYTPPEMKFCSHDVEIACLPAMCYYFYLAQEKNRLRDWFYLSFVTAIAFLGKYSAAQILPAFLIYLCLSAEGRSRLRSWRPYASALLFLLLILPHIFWLFDHDFAAVRHLSERMEQAKQPWYEFLLIILTACYPVLLHLALLSAAVFFHKERVRVPMNKNALLYAGLCSAVPVLIFVGISLTGGNVLLPWLSFLASATGIVAVSVFPWRADRTVFRTLWLLLMAYTLVMLAAATVDLLVNPRFKIHTRPEDIVEPGRKLFAEAQGGREIPVTVGERWLAGVVENYSSHRPPACVLNDPCNLELVRGKVEREGALLMAQEPHRFGGFLAAMGRPAVKYDEKEKAYLFADGTSLKMTRVRIPYRARWSKEKTKPIWYGVFPPCASIGKTSGAE